MRLYTAFCLVWLLCPALDATDEPKVICYYQGTATAKIGYAKMAPSEIDPHLCTHLIYLSVSITQDGNVTVLYPQLDLPDNGGKAGFQKFNALRKQNERLKTLVSSYVKPKYFTQFSKILADVSLRSKYAENVVNFVRRHEFDGIVIRWRWPDLDSGSSHDSDNFLLLLKELRASFDERKLILSIAVDGRESWARRQFPNIPEMSTYVDLILLTMKSHNPARARHLSPLYPSRTETSNLDLTLNCDAAVNYWLDESAPAEKLILVTSFDGQGFVLENSTKHEPGSPANVSHTGNFNPHKSYNEICRIISRATWTTVWDEEPRVPYSYGGDEWISYENARSLYEKAKYVREMGLGGVSVRSIDQDDRRGDCGERYPLINALTRGLRPTNRSSSVSTTEASIPAKDTGKVVCVYRSSATNNFGYARMVPSRISPNLCTHLIYSDVGTTGDGNVTVLRPQIDLPDNGGKAGFEQLNALRKQNPRLKTLVSTGSGQAGGSAIFSKIAANKSLRSKYAGNVIDFLLRHRLDGFDIHWGYPTDNGGSPDDVQNFVVLLKELRTRFDEHKLILSIVVWASQVKAQKFYNIPEISKYVDFIQLAVIFHSSGDLTTGHFTALYPSARETSSLDLSRNWNASVHYWLTEGAPAEKLILRMYFYGESFVLQNSAEHRPGSPSTVPQEKNVDPYKSYNEICRLVSQDGWTTVWDEEQRVPYSYSRNQWISYDNARSLVEKGKYVRAMGLGGVAAWSIDQDDHRGYCGQRFLLMNALICGLRDVGCSSIPTTEAPRPIEVTGQMASGSMLSPMGGNVSTTPKVDEMTVDPQNDAKRICAQFDIKYVRHPHDHAKFWICQQINEGEFHAEPFKCGRGLCFDTKKIICKPTCSMEFH